MGEALTGIAKGSRIDGGNALDQMQRVEGAKSEVIHLSQRFITAISEYITHTLEAVSSLSGEMEQVGRERVAAEMMLAITDDIEDLGNQLEVAEKIEKHMTNKDDTSIIKISDLSNRYDELGDTFDITTNNTETSFHDRIIALVEASIESETPKDEKLRKQIKDIEQYIIHTKVLADKYQACTPVRQAYAVDAG